MTLLGYQNCGMKQSQTEYKPGDSFGAGQEHVMVTGTLQKSGIDGCKFLIKNDQNQYFIPVQLDPALQQDGSNLKISGTVRTDLVSTCMGGTIIQVDKAEVVQ